MSIEKIHKAVAGSHGGGYFGLCCITPLKVSVCNNAPWTSKTSRFCRRHRLDSVRRSCLDRAVLPAHPFARRGVAARSICSAQQPLQRQRILGGVALSTHPGSGTNRDDRTVAAQWRLSLSGGLAGVSRSHQFATLLAAVRSGGAQCFAEIARPLARRDAGAAAASDFQPGQHRTDGLRPSGTSRSGLQPEKARASLLPSAAVLRRTDARLLGGQLSCGQRLRLDGRHPVAGARFYQIAAARGAGSRARRRRLLRSQNHRIYRGETRILCDRRPTHSPAEAPALWVALPTCVAWSLGGGAPLLPAELARASTLRRHSPTRAGRAFGPTDSVSDGRLQLSSVGHQLDLDAAAPLALLQSARSRGVDHPRIEGCLRLGENPDERLCRQRGLLPDRAAGLQSAELVQGALCSGSPATSDAATFAAAVVSGPVPVGSARRRADPAPRAKLPLCLRLPRDTAAHPPVAVAVRSHLNQSFAGAARKLVEGHFQPFFTQDSG